MVDKKFIIKALYEHPQPYYCTKCKTVHYPHHPRSYGRVLWECHMNFTDDEHIPTITLAFANKMERQVIISNVIQELKVDYYCTKCQKEHKYGLPFWNIHTYYADETKLPQEVKRLVR